jgi:anti-sigma28 factor (negative regulator of flagellin synthesis)
MIAMESAQVGLRGAEGATGEDGALWLGVAERMRTSGKNDGAISGQEQSPDRSSPIRSSSRLAGSGAPVAALDLSDVRMEEVVRLRVAIASGHYRVSAADLADKLIAAFTAVPQLDGLERRN